MKKIFPLILIVLIAVQLFAPFSIGSGKNDNLEMRSNKAEAVWPVPDDNGIALQSIISNTTEKSFTITVNVSWSNKGAFTKEGVRVTKTDIKNGTSESKKSDDDFPMTNTGKLGPLNAPIYTGSVVFDKNTNPGTIYSINTEARQLNALQFSTGWDSSDLWGPSNSTPSDKIFITTTNDTVTTNPAGVQTVQPSSTQNAQNDNAILAPYSCNPLAAGTWTGCAGRIVYTVIFQPAAWLFALSGKFLDWTFFYSVSDGAYRSNFVVEGWAILRDVCNMFFIFVLLYIAVGTILKLNAVKTKEMIINVVLIGLFINFSLFVTQVIIDSSNILARVFYNTNIIVAGNTKDSTGAIISTPNKDGSIRMSEAIVNKINPQDLIVNSQKTSEDGQPLSAGAFLTISILASAVSIVGFLTFLTVGLIFIARVIGLWLAMVMAPIAFFTYTIPQLQDSKNIGWKNWWPETIKLAFMAPLFMFFMYILIKFLAIGLGVFTADKEVGMAFIIAIMVPFIFIMIFLLKAKSIATSMSGELGAMVSKAGSAIGGLALGAATGGYAMLGRATIGRYAGSVADNEKLKEKAKEGGFGGFQARMKLKAANYGKKASFDARATTLGGLAGKGLGVDLGKAQQGGYAGHQERRIKQEIANNEMLKLSPSAALAQDEKAKNYNTVYQKAMVDEKKSVEDAGGIFKEQEFKKIYEDPKGPNGPRVKNADQTNIDRMKERTKSVQNSSVMSEQVKAGVLKDLKTKSKPEKPPLNPVEEDNAKRTIIKSEKELTNIESDMKKLIVDPKNLTVIIDPITGDHKFNEVNKSVIEIEINNRGALIANEDTKIGQANAALAQNPYNNKARQDLLDANKAKKEIETEIRKLGSMVDNREKHKGIVEQQSNILASNVQK